MDESLIMPELTPGMHIKTLIGELKGKPLAIRANVDNVIVVYRWYSPSKRYLNYGTFQWSYLELLWQHNQLAIRRSNVYRTRNHND